jgi:hypothetical protein
LAAKSNKWIALLWMRKMVIMNVGLWYYLYVISTMNISGSYLMKSISWFSIGLEHYTSFLNHISFRIGFCLFPQHIKNPQYDKWISWKTCSIQ